MHDHTKQSGAPGDAAPKASDEASRIRELEASLAAREGELAQLRRSHEIEALLTSAGARDIDTVRLLIERELDRDEAIDASAAIETLRVAKPFLFVTAPGGGAEGDGGDAQQRSRASAAGRGAMSPRLDPRPGERIQDAADEARSSGRMADLLRYMRLRRKTIQRE